MQHSLIIKTLNRFILFALDLNQLAQITKKGPKAAMLKLIKHELHRENPS